MSGIQIKTRFSEIMQVWVLLFYCISINAVHAQMPPFSLTPEKLPFTLEGYTIVKDQGNTSLYQDYSELPASNVYNKGGISIEIEKLMNLPGDKQGLSDASKFETGMKYVMRIRVSEGRSFDKGTRIIENLHGPGSQVIMHLPASVMLANDHSISVDGKTVSQEMAHVLWSVAGIGIPQIGNITGAFVRMIVDAIGKALGDRIIEASYNKFRPTQVIEIAGDMNLNMNEELKQITWQLGSWNARDYLSLHNAEITIPLEFKVKGTYDISLYFNLWGQHTLSDPGNVLTSTVRGVMHSFRQHVVIRVNVSDPASVNTLGLRSDLLPFFKRPDWVNAASYEIITNTYTPENPKNLQLRYHQSNQKITMLLMQSSEFWRNHDHSYNTHPSTIKSSGSGITSSRLTSSGYRVLLTTGLMGRWQAYVLLENNVVATVNGSGYDAAMIQAVLDNLDLKNFVSLFIGGTMKR